MDEQSIHVDTEALEWQEAPGEGVFVKKLFRDPASGRSAMLIKLEAGAVYHSHRHIGGEHYYVLEGTLEDGGATIGKGGFVYHHPDSAHRPRSTSGCIVFVALGGPVIPVGEGECHRLFASS